MNISLIFLIVLILLPSSSQAAAWLKEVGEGLLIANVQQYTSNKYWNRQGHLKSGPRFNQFSVNPYLEYGAFPCITLGLNPFAKRISQRQQVSKFGLNNITPFALILIRKKDWSSFSAQISYNQPFKSKFFGPNQPPLSVYGIIDRQRYLDLRLLYGTGGTFDKAQTKTWYADGEVSFRRNFDGAADEIHVDFMLGFKILNQKLIFEVKELNTFGLHNPKNNRLPNYSLFTIIPNIQFWMTDTIGFQFGVQQDFYGINIGKGNAPFVALWWKF